jgi:flagellar hook-length control protein FliK
MTNKAAQSEMRIGLNTSAFGNVEVRTVVHANDVGIVIGSEKGDLRSLISTELPAVANTLQQQNLRLSQVSFHQQGFAFSNQTSSGRDSQSQSFRSKTVQTTSRQGDVFSIESSEPEERPKQAYGRGLSVLA